jgi:hypothetical protein
VVITMMPDIAQRIGVPRAVAVEFPFGHTLGHAHDEREHRAVLTAALELLEEAAEPGTIVPLELIWPDPDREWHKRWHPPEPSPILKLLRGT